MSTRSTVFTFDVSRVLANLFGGRLQPSEWYPAREPSLTARHLQLRTGERVRVVEGGAEGGSGAAPVLFVHGWGCSAYFFRKLLPAVAATGRRVVALDLRGHGGSDKPTDAAHYTADAMADFLDAALEALALGRPAVVAHSLGGAVVLDVAARSPDRFTSLALLAPVGLAPLRFIALMRLATPLIAAPMVPYAVPRWSIPLALRSVYGSLGEYAARDVDEYWAPTQDPAFALALRALLHTYRFGARSDDELARVTVPTLALFGGRDLLVRSAASARRIPVLPRATERTIARAGHVLAEEVPEDVLIDLIPHLADSG